MPHSANLCCVIHSEGHPRDATGCQLPIGHEGPHEYRDEFGQPWLWETDFSCTCEACWKNEDGDYCTVYWRKPGPFLRLTDDEN